MISADLLDVNDESERRWEGFKSAASPASNVETLGCRDIIEFRVGPSVEVLAGGDDRFDVIFLDGSHEADVVYQEIPLALKRLEDSGMIILHDFFPGGRALWPDMKPLQGVYRAIERFRSEGADFHCVPLGDLPWPTKLGTRTTSLAVLSR